MIERMKPSAGVILSGNSRVVRIRSVITEHLIRISPCGLVYMRLQTVMFGSRCLLFYKCLLMMGGWRWFGGSYRNEMFTKMIRETWSRRKDCCEFTRSKMGKR